MASRVGPAALLALIVVLLGATSPARSSLEAAGSIYVVRPDPRLCPSPLCGGYWVSVANQARTRCHDNLLRPRCYVTDVTASLGKPLGVPADSLVRGTMGSHTVLPEHGRLGTLAAAEVWVPAGRRDAVGDYFRVTDTGVRCIRAPCPSYKVERLNTSRSFTASGVDLLFARSTASEAERAQLALSSRRGLLVLGTVVRTAEAGRIVQAGRLYLLSRR